MLFVSEARAWIRDHSEESFNSKIRSDVSFKQHLEKIGYVHNCRPSFKTATNLLTAYWNNKLSKAKKQPYIKKYLNASAIYKKEKMQNMSQYSASDVTDEGKTANILYHT